MLDADTHSVLNSCVLSTHSLDIHSPYLLDIYIYIYIYDVYIYYSIAYICIYIYVYALAGMRTPVV